MATLKDFAKGYEPLKTHNISDLTSFDINTEIEELEGIDSDGNKFTYKAIIVDGKEYRVPNPVIEQIKSLLSVKDDIKNVKVHRSGVGLKTKYEVRVLDNNIVTTTVTV